jgi:preprotein translocase subunit YajC
VNIILGMFWGVFFTAIFIAIIRQAAYRQKRKKWAKDIRPGKGLGL